ncbi:MAG: hypothetical protein ACRD8O_08110 [Bryobacteraceae bacterium]
MQARPALLWLILTLAAALLGQQAAQKKESQPAEKKETSSPLFTGKLGIRSSQKTKESATLGFNGIDPSGKVDQKMLATSPSAADQEKVQQMTSNAPTGEDLKTFLTEGGLNAK